jgi:hypothetical protein
MKTFENTKYTKKHLVDQVQAHYDADEIRKNLYWKDGKGCCVGCWVHSANHSLFEEYFGVPASIAHLADAIFEGLPNAEAKEFPLELAKSIPEGVDLGLVKNKFLHWLLVDPENGVIRFNDAHAIRNVALLHERVINGVSVTDCEWAAARDAARDAALAAARSAARSVARSVARSSALAVARSSALADDVDVVWAVRAAADAVRNATWDAALAAADADAAWASARAARAAARDVVRNATCASALAAADVDATWDAALASAVAADVNAAFIGQKNKLIELIRDEINAPVPLKSGRISGKINF